jgi:hypothetical protein
MEERKGATRRPESRWTSLSGRVVEPGLPQTRSKPQLPTTSSRTAPTLLRRPRRHPPPARSAARSQRPTTRERSPRTTSRTSPRRSRGGAAVDVHEEPADDPRTAVSKADNENQKAKTGSRLGRDERVALVSDLLEELVERVRELLHALALDRRGDVVVVDAGLAERV